MGNRKHWPWMDLIHPWPNPPEVRDESWLAKTAPYAHPPSDGSLSQSEERLNKSNTRLHKPHTQKTNTVQTPTGFAFVIVVGF